MTTVTFDTHKFVKTLEAAGLPEQQAEAISSAVRDAQDHAEMASKSDLKEIELRLDARFEKLNGEMTLIKWMLGLIVAGTATLILKSFF